MKFERVKCICAIRNDIITGAHTDTHTQPLKRACHVNIGNVSEKSIEKNIINFIYSMVL